MVKMNKLKPVHNHFEPPIASMKEAKIASGSLSGKGGLTVVPARSRSKGQRNIPPVGVRCCGGAALRQMSWAKGQRVFR